MPGGENTSYDMMDGKMIALEITLGFVLAAVFSLAIVPVLVKFSYVYGLFDLPDHGVLSRIPSGEGRKVHLNPTPRLGGIAIFLSFFITNLLWFHQTPLKIPLLISAVVFILGLLDDVYQLSARTRLLVQGLSAAIAAHLGGLVLTHIALTPSIAIAIPHGLGLILSAFVIVGAINSINMIDGLDGLAGGFVLIGITLLSFLYFLRTHDTYLLLCLTIPIVGAILGFLRYNTFPATIFMGDSGSNWLGFMVGILLLVVLENQAVTFDHGQVVMSQNAIISGEAPYIPIVSAILTLAVPIFDTACVMLSRLREGLSPMAADRRHFHHTLLRLGLSHSQSVSAVYFLALASGILGIVPVIFAQYNFWWVPYAMSLGLLLLIPTNIKASKVVVDRLIRFKARFAKKQALGTTVGVWLRYWDTMNRYTLYLIFLACPAFAGAINPQLGYSALIAGIFLIIVGFYGPGQHDFFDSIAISFAAIILLAANNLNGIAIELSGHKINIQSIYNGLYIFLFFSTFLLIIATIKKRYFVFTPSDFLLLIIPVLILLVPEPYKTLYHMDVIALRSLVVFMTLRTMVKRRRQTFYHLRMVTLSALAFVVLTGVWGMHIVY